MASMSHVNLDIQDGIGTVEFFTEQSNSLPGEILRKLAETVTSAGTNPEVKVIVLKSGGERAFCAGASFDELIAIEDPVAGNEFFMGFANVINAMRKTPQLIIGRVQGKAVGGGIGLASATDYCFATQYASIKLSELAVGIGPFVVGPAVQRKMGVSAMSQMAINATEFHDAAWAREKGLYAQVYEDAASMDAAVQELAKKLAASNPEAMSNLKQIFWEGTENWDQLLSDRAQISGNLVTSDFTKSFIQKFKSK